MSNWIEKGREGGFPTSEQTMVVWSLLWDVVEQAGKLFPDGKTLALANAIAALRAEVEKEPLVGYDKSMFKEKK